MFITKKIILNQTGMKEEEREERKKEMERISGFIGTKYLSAIDRDDAMNESDDEDDSEDEDYEEREDPDEYDGNEEYEKDERNEEDDIWIQSDDYKLEIPEIRRVAEKDDKSNKEEEEEDAAYHFKMHVMTRPMMTYIKGRTRIIEARTPGEKCSCDPPRCDMCHVIVGEKDVIRNHIYHPNMSWRQCTEQKIIGCVKCIIILANYARNTKSLLICKYYDNETVTYNYKET